MVSASPSFREQWLAYQDKPKTLPITSHCYVKKPLFYGENGDGALCRGFNIVAKLSFTGLLGLSALFLSDPVPEYFWFAIEDDEEHGGLCVYRYATEDPLGFKAPEEAVHRSKCSNGGSIDYALYTLMFLEQRRAEWKSSVHVHIKSPNHSSAYEQFVL